MKERKMKPNPQKVLDEAMQLEPTTRAFIAETLLESLDFEEDFEISEAWQEEIRRRCEEIDSGQSKLVNSEIVFAELRKRYPA
jgi:putative addiction module component (TIGR02574 family)